MKSLVLALALFTGNAFACSCGPWGSAAEMLSFPEVVSFVGTFKSASSGEINPDTGLPFVVTQFKVIKAFKPKVMRPIFITRSDKANGGNCGTNFKPRTKYLVFGFRNAGKVYTDACSYQEINNTPAQNAFLIELNAASSAL